MRRMQVTGVKPGVLICQLNGAEVTVIGRGPRPDDYIYAFQLDGVWRLGS